jgi:hypothetical protein
MVMLLGACGGVKPVPRADISGAPRVQTSVPESLAGRPSSCAAIVAAALERSSTLHAARAGLPVLRAERAAATDWSAPELRLRDNLAAPGVEPRVGLRVALPGPGVGGARAMAALEREVLSRAELGLLEAEVAHAARALIAEIRHARRALTVRSAYAEASREHAADMARLETAGMGNGLVGTTTRLEALEAVEEVEVRTTELGVLERGLAVRTGGGRVDDVSSCEASVSAELSIFEEHARAARAAADAERVEAVRSAWIWPSFLEFAWQRDETAGLRTDRILAEVGVQLALPGPDEADVAEAKLEQVKAESEAQVEAARARFDEAVDAVARARATVRRLEEMKPEIERARDLAEQARRAGAQSGEVRGLWRKVLDHQRRLDDATLVLELAVAEWIAASGRTGLEPGGRVSTRGAEGHEASGR